MTERCEEQPFEVLFDLTLRNGIYKKKNFHGSGVPIINMGEIFADSRIRALPENLIEVTDSELERFGVEQGDLLFGRRSLVWEGSGKTSLVEDLGRAAVFESSLIRVRLDRTKADPDYYLAYFTSPEGRSRVLSIASQTAVSGIRGSDLAKLAVPVPSLRLQKQIGFVFRKLDDLIEINRRRIEILEETARLLYQEWFVNFRYPGHENVPLVDSELGPVPDDFRVLGLFDLADVAYGDQLSKKSMKGGPMPVYGAAKRIGFYDKANVQSSTLIMGCRGSCGEVTLTEAPAFVTNNSFLICPHSSELQIYLYLALDYRGVGAFITGTAQPQITLNNLEFLNLLVPNFDLLAHFNSLVSPFIEEIKALDSSVKVLSELRDLLLPRLVSGELDVSDLDFEMVS